MKLRRNYTTSQEDALFLGKVMDHMDDEALKDLGFTPAERVRACWVWDDLSTFLNDQWGPEWNEKVAI